MCPFGRLDLFGLHGVSPDSSSRMSTSSYAFEHPDRSRMIDRAEPSNLGRRRSSPHYHQKPESRSRDHGRGRDRNGIEESSRNGRRDRSRSPYRRYDEPDSRNRARSRSPKRRRRTSPSSSPDRRRRDSREEVRRSRRRTSSSGSPRHFQQNDRKSAARSRRKASNSPRPRLNSSPDSYKRSKRRSSRPGSPRDHPPKSRDKSHQSKHPHKQSPTRSPHPSTRSVIPLPSQKDAFARDPAVIKPGDPLPAEKEKPNYAPTGALARETNTVAGTATVLKYNEPPESRLPPASAPWRMYVFKGEQEVEKLDLYTRSCWLLGRERAVVDVPIEHPSCSKQHAVVQFRYVEKRGEYGDRKGGVKPYIIDLDSSNGTMLNGEKLDGRRYMELRTGDVLKFGESTRDYVLLLPPKS